MYKTSVSPELAVDAINFIFHNPLCSLKRAEIKEFDHEGNRRQMLVLIYNKVIGEQTVTTQFDMPIEHVIELLTFSLITIDSAHQLTQGHHE
jgi:hypothetical protein